jgi:hypothetical protein
MRQRAHDRNLLCRINAAFLWQLERRIYAAEPGATKNLSCALRQRSQNYLLDHYLAAATMPGVMIKIYHRLAAAFAPVFLTAISPILAQTAAPHWNVLEAGAKGDGEMDGTAIFQKLLDDAGKAGGGVVEVPAGRLKGSNWCARPGTWSAMSPATPANAGFTSMNAMTSATSRMSTFGLLVWRINRTSLSASGLTPTASRLSSRAPTGITC